MSKLLPQILEIFLMLLIPVVIILGAMHLIATEPYLAFEYGRPDFPEDSFGFAGDQRLIHAAASLQFVTQSQPLADLVEQNHNGTPLYNARELKHMQDVQNVYQAAWRVWQIGLVLIMFSGVGLAWRKENRLAFAFGLRSGGALTVGIVAGISLAAIVARQSWFVLFYQVFFAAGNWMFGFFDTLIHLFPEKFWYDSALTISSFSLIAGFLVYWICYRTKIVVDS